MKMLAIVALSISVLFGCSVEPKSGKSQSKNASIDFSMWVLTANPEAWVRWEAANVDSSGNVLNWESVSFITKANASAPITIGSDTYRIYNDSQPIFNWTKANTGYTGGCGNVANSCPEHALIRAQLGYSGGPSPALVFPESGGAVCLFNNVLVGWVSVVQNCPIANADGIVVVFAE